jgi:CDP-glycerol glycerophosphotransferase
MGRFQIIRRIGRKLSLPHRGNPPKPEPTIQAEPVQEAPGPGLPEKRPALSVIVPVYNVEPYLEDCLRSILRQSFRSLEVVVVDDGSTDRSLEIARAVAVSNRRIHIVAQENAGLGAARNTGIRYARGEFLAFADSDDIVPQHAYRAMMGSLERSGSDFAVGSLKRLAGKQRFMTAWVSRVHRVTRTAIAVEDFPDILQDVFAWNKVFRRSFWDEHVGQFPDGLYEDQEPAGRAYLRSRQFDVLSDVVYEWRLRRDGSSITQKKTQVSDLKARVEVIMRVHGLMAAEAATPVYQRWLAKSLGPDLGHYYQQLPRVGDEYWRQLRHAVVTLSGYADSAVWDLLNVHERIVAKLIADLRLLLSD